MDDLSANNIMSSKTDTKKGPIHICFVSLAAYPLFNPRAEHSHGGSAVDIYMIATELIKDPNFTVSVITGNYGQPDVEVIDGITIYKTADLQTHPITATLDMYKAMCTANADIYFRKTASLVTVMVALFCRLKNKLFFYRSAHIDHCDGTYLKQHWFRGRLFKWALRHAAVASVQNRMDIDLLKQTTGVDSVLIPNGHRLGTSEQKQRDGILWVGRTANFKRPQLFVRLAKTFPDEKFVMICSRSEADPPYDTLKLNEVDNLEFHKLVPFTEIDDHFQKAKVFVSTSDAEGFPNTFIQACKCAAPILSLNVNPDGFLDEYNCGICCDDDWRKFVVSLKVMLTDNRYIELGKNAGKYVQQRHDITKIIEQYKKLFTETVQDKPGNT